MDTLIAESDAVLVDEVKIDYCCPVCKELLTEPFLTDCGHHVCGTCCDNQLLVTNNANCPVCREHNVLRNARLDKSLERKVKSHKVHCEHYDEGCDWVGEVKDLQNHLDPEKGFCSHVAKVLKDTQRTTCEYCNRICTQYNAHLYTVGWEIFIGALDYEKQSHELSTMQ